MRKQSKKLIAPIIITTILVLYFGVFLLTWAQNPLQLGMKIVGIVIPLAIIGVSIFVLVERIKEIRSGEEDDLSKY